MPRTKKILNAEEEREKVLMRKKVVARYTAKPHAKELARARYLRYKNDPASTYNKPRVKDALECQKKDQQKYYQKKKDAQKKKELLNNSVQYAQPESLNCE